MSIDKRFAEFINSMRAVPPLKMKGSPDLDKPSKSINARITFSISILSAFRLSFDTLSIHSAVRVSLLIISIDWQHPTIAAENLVSYEDN